MHGLAVYEKEGLSSAWGLSLENSVDKGIKNRGLELVTSRSSGHETSSEKFLCYILSDQV